MPNMTQYKDDELLIVSDPDDKDYNSITINVAPRCTCGGQIEPLNRDDMVFMGDEKLVVIATLCKKCKNHGILHINMDF